MRAFETKSSRSQPKIFKGEFEVKGELAVSKFEKSGERGPLNSH